jgi:multisubunit Na+/H+ antiporter MnhB subunit
MVYLILVIVIVSIRDIKDLKSKNRKKDLYVYVIIMLLVGALGIFYYLNPERDSFSKTLLSLIGKEGGL